MPQNATYTGDFLLSKTALLPVPALDFLYSAQRDISNIRYMLLPDYVLFTRYLIRYCRWLTQMFYRLLSLILSNYHGIIPGSPSDLHVKLHFLPGNVFPASCISPCREMTGQVFLFPLLPSRFRFPLLQSHFFIKTTSLWSCRDQELVTRISFLFHSWRTVSLVDTYWPGIYSDPTNTKDYEHIYCQEFKMLFT